jgi:Fe-S-cluster containining protein
VPAPSIETIDDLKREVGRLLDGISDACRECTYPDCQGYPWIMPDEENALLEAGVRLIQFNGERGPIYLDTFERRPDGSLAIGKEGVKCPYRAADGRCSIHADRPLICHIYPLSMEFRGGVPVWAVHHDCEFIQRAIKGGRIDGLLDGFRDLIARLGADLRAAFHTTITRSASVSSPTEMDCYYFLSPVAG